MLQGFGHPETELTKFTGRGGGGRRFPGTREDPTRWKAAAPSPPWIWRGGGQEAGLGREPPEDWGPARKDPGKKEGGRVGGRTNVARASPSHSPSGPSFAPAPRRLRAGSALLPPSACWASRRPQTPLATTHRHATRVPSRRRRGRLPGTARAPSGQTEGLEGAIAADAREAGARNLGCCGAWESRPRLAHAQSLQRARALRAEFWEM